MDDLATWLTAQVDTDERVALAAGGDDWAENGSGDVVSAALARGDYSPAGYWVTSASWQCEGEAERLHEGHAAHIALNDPARVLRNVKAARLIIAAHPRDYNDFCATCVDDWTNPVGIAWPCPTLRAVASQYDDREGFRPEWAPAVDLGPLEPGTVITPPPGQTVTWSE